jgi:hypothetical protein
VQSIRLALGTNVETVSFEMYNSFFLFLLFSTDFFHVFNRQLLVQSSKAQWWVIVYLICGFLFKKIKNKIKIRKLDISSIA